MSDQAIQVPIDAAGRVVIPKLLRQRLGLSDGSQFQIREESGDLILHPLPETAPLCKKQSVLVVASVAQDSERLSHETVQTLTKKLRENR